MSIEPGYHRDLIFHFRRHVTIPDEWVRRLSDSCDLDEAARRAWALDADGYFMALLAVHFAERSALTLATVDLARTLLRFLPKKRLKVPVMALDYAERWATVPGTPEPKEGWPALAAAVDQDDGDSLAALATARLAAALYAPKDPRALARMALNVVEQRGSEIAHAEGYPRTEGDVDELDDRAQHEIHPVLAERIRARIPAPTGAALVAALKEERDEGLQRALRLGPKRASF